MIAKSQHFHLQAWESKLRPGQENNDTQAATMILDRNGGINSHFPYRGFSYIKAAVQVPGSS